MAAGIYNFTIEQGIGFNRTLTYREKDNADGTPGALINLTAYTARMQIRKTVDATDVEVELTTANGRIVLGGVAGTVQLIIPSEVTALLDFQDAVYDLELIPSGGEPSRLVQGTVVLSKEVTR